MAQNTSTNTRLWQLHCFFKPHLKSWGENYVLFDEASGDTHMLDQLAGYVLESLIRSPKSIELLSHAYCNENDYSYAEIEAQISHIISELNKLHFVQEVKN